MRPLLRGLRRVRGGSLDLQAVPSAVRDVLQGNLAGACRALAVAAEAAIDDPRACDAFLRTYGLGRMPETRAGIGRTLRSATGRRGISTSAVDDLVRSAEAQLVRRIDRITVPGPWGAPTPDVWVDPYAGAATAPEVRRRLQKVLYAAWADIPDEPVHECSAALLLYEREHGLREGPVPPCHREQRRRLRRLAWSMLTVARERQIAKQPDDILVDLLLGPRRLAVVENLPEGAATLLGGVGPAAPDQLEQAVDHVRDAVRHGRAEAPELLGLVREAMARGVHPAAVSTLTSGIACQAAIVARESRQAAGALAASEAVTLAAEAADTLARTPARNGERRAQLLRTLHDGLRAAQEMAELHDVLGQRAAARRSLRLMGALLRHLPSDDEDEVQGWLQQHLQTRAVLARHTTSSSRHPTLWLNLADRAAETSLEIAERDLLPLGCRLVPSSQLLGTAIVDLRLHGTASPGSPARLERQARARLARAMSLSSAITGTLDRPTHSARLSVARRWWKLALLCQDPDEIVAARAEAQALVQACTLPHDLEKLGWLEALSRARGIPASDLTVPATACPSGG